MARGSLLTPTNSRSPIQRKNTMNLKSLFGLKAASDVSPELQAMAERVSTAAGCEALAEELEQQLSQSAAGDIPRNSVLRRKLAELARLRKAHAIAQDRVRVTAVVKRDQDAASKALKAAEAKLKAAGEAAAKAAAALADRTAEVDRMKQDLAELHAAADKAVEIARKGFADAVAADDVSAEGEAAAFAAIKKAQAHRETCGELQTARIKSREAGLSDLQRASADASGAIAQAQDDLSLARLQLARVEYDQAAQSMVDAYIKQLSLSSFGSDGRAFKGSAIHELDLTFASAERAVLGSQLIGESGRVSGYVLADMAAALKPADLALLTTEIPAPKQPERPLDLPNPFLHLEGSNEHTVADIELKKATKGMSESEFENVRNRLRVQASEQRLAQAWTPLAQ